jgi:hypothetical protein
MKQNSYKYLCCSSSAPPKSTFRVWRCTQGDHTLALVCMIKVSTRSTVHFLFLYVQQERIRWDMNGPGWGFFLGKRMSFCLTYFTPITFKLSPHVIFDYVCRQIKFIVRQKAAIFISLSTLSKFTFSTKSYYS